MSNAAGARSKMTAQSDTDPPVMNNESQKKKDGWDRAQIISGFVSSVVIAAVGILINNSIQRAQLEASKANTQAQLEVTDRNNKAQLALTERTADLQRHLQEGTLIGQLVEHLTSGSTLKKQLVIVVLRRSIPPDMYQDVITTIVKSDTDPEVRKTALEQARTLRDVAPSVAQAIDQAANDSNRPSEERQLATNAIRQIGLAAAAPSNTWMLSASGSGQTAFKGAKPAGNVFTHYLLRGLAGEASINKDGNVSLSALSQYVISRVKTATNAAELPVFTSPDNSADPVIVGPRADYSKIVSVVIGNSRYRESLPLLFGAFDAESFAGVWRNRINTKATVYTNLVVDATRPQIIEALDGAQRLADRNSLAIFYYSGYAVTLEGQGWLLPVDTRFGDEDSVRQSSISTADVRDMLSRSSARIQVLFIDAAFPQVWAARGQK